MIAKVNGVELYYEKTGQGRPLLLVHGNSEDHSIFNEAAAVLREDFCVYAVDSADTDAAAACARSTMRTWPRT